MGWPTWIDIPQGLAACRLSEDDMAEIVRLTDPTSEAHKCAPRGDCAVCGASVLIAEWDTHAAACRLANVKRIRAAASGQSSLFGDIPQKGLGL